MRALVTGGAGFLGQSLERELLSNGTQVRCLVRSSRSAARMAGRAEFAGVQFVQGSLSCLDAVEPAFAGCDVVFHLAAAMRGAVAGMFADNVVATRKLIAVVSRAAVRRFVLVSSMGVYGTAHLCAGDTLDESCPLDGQPQSRDGYTFSKIAQEKIAWEAHRAGNLGLVVVRPGVLFGPGRDCLSNRVGLRLGSCLLKMGGKQRLPYAFVENAAQAIAKVGTFASIEGEAFNVVDDDLPTANELLKQYRREVNRIRVLPVPYRFVRPLSRMCVWYHRYAQGQLPAILTAYKSDAQWKPLCYSNEKAKSVVGWQPRTNFAEGLRRTFRWIREQENRPAEM